MQNTRQGNLGVCGGDFPGFRFQSVFSLRAKTYHYEELKTQNSKGKGLSLSHTNVKYMAR